MNKDTPSLEDQEVIKSCFETIKNKIQRNFKVSIILASTNHPGRKVLYNNDYPDGLLLEPEDDTGIPLSFHLPKDRGNTSGTMNFDHRKARVEALAEKIYNSWNTQEGWKPWEVGGNSDKQIEARSQAADKIQEDDQMSRSTNNELSALPGFFFYPKDTEGLEELTFDQRTELLTNQGVHSASLVNKNDPRQVTDLNNAFDNGRIPTHRRPGVEIPSYGNVPFDLRQIIEVRGV